MAFYSDDDDEKNQASNGEAVSKPSSGLVAGQGGAPGQASAAAAPAEMAKSSTPGNHSSPFVGINEYLNANKQQSGKLGSTVGNYVGGKIDNASQKLGEAEQNFGKQVEAGTTNVNDNNLVKAIERDPNQVLKDQNTLNQVRGIQKGYQGPTDFQSNAAYQGVKGDLDKAKSAVGNLGSATGQTSLLENQQAETRGGKLNRGAATLDQALLQASPEAQAALKPTFEKGAGLNNNINQTIQNAMNKVAGGQKTSQESSQALKNAFDTQYAQQQQALGQRAAETNKSLQQQESELQGRLYGGATDQDLASLGLGRGQYDSLMNDFKQYGPQGGLIGPQGSFTSFLHASNPNANAQNVATADDYARAQALNQLAGYGGEYLGNSSLAGSYNKNLASFDTAGAQNFINELKSKALAAQQQGGGGGGDGGQASPNVMNQIVQGAILGGVPGAEIGAVVGAGGGGGWTPSDKNIKTGIKPFHADKFLETISQGKKKVGAKYGT